MDPLYTTHTEDPPKSPTGAPPRRPELSGARRVVVKLGTRVLVDGAGDPRRERLEALAESVATIRRTSRQVIVVTSGAVGLGRGLLGYRDPLTTVEDRRACAAVGQAALQALYREAFAGQGLLTAQVLLTGQDFARRRQPRLRETFERLLSAGVVLVVNENDAVSLGANGNRPAFHDNDGLAALVAQGCRADLLVLLTDVPGVFERDPRRHPGLAHLDRIDDPSSFLTRLGTSEESAVSRGGMRSKVAAAALATRSGCRTVIASGDEIGVVERIVSGEAVGTYFPSGIEFHHPRPGGTS